MATWAMESEGKRRKIILRKYGRERKRVARETHSVECDGAAKFSSLQAGHVQLLPLHKRFHLHIMICLNIMMDIMLCLNIMVGMIAILALVAELTMTLAKIVIIVAEVETNT